MEGGGSGVGAVVAKGGGGVSAAGAGVVSMVAASPAESGTSGAQAPSTMCSEAASFSRGGVASEVWGGAFGSSEESEDSTRRLLKDVPDWGTEKAGLLVDSGGLNKLPDAAPFAKSDPGESSADFWTPGPKLNCAAPLPIPSPLSPKVKEAGEGLAEPSLASSPWPTRSPEKLPSVSPPTVLGGCGSTLRAVAVEVGLAASPGGFGGRVGEAVRRAGEVDFGLKENPSSPAGPNPILPFTPKENLLTSFAGERDKE